MPKVYRVEDKTGLGPYTSDLFVASNINYWEQPTWMHMLREHQRSDRHPGPYYDWINANANIANPFFNNGISRYKFGCPSAETLLGWFRLLGDLVDAGFLIVELEVKESFISKSGFQCAYDPSKVDTIRQLSYRELKDIANAHYSEVD